MRTLLKISLMLTAALFISSCGDKPKLKQTPKKEENQPENIIKKTSKADLENKIKDSLVAEYGQISESYFYLASAESSLSSLASSMTNTQESSVDEADRLKTDGNYLYVNKVNSSGINIFKANKTDAPLVSSLEVMTDNSSVLSGLYLLNEAKQLLAISSDNPQDVSIWANWFQASFWQQRKTELFTIDVNDPTKPTQIHKLSVDGQLISSRRIGDVLYLVTRHTPYLTGLINQPINDSEVEKNKQLITAATLENFLPTYQIDAQSSQPLFSANDCFVADTGSSSHQQSSIISLIAIDLSTPEPSPTGQCFVGDTETIYVSAKSIYLATTQYDYNEDNNGLSYNEQTSTEIHKFSLANKLPEYTSSGSIKGHLGWQQDLKPFRMSEHNDVLRVVSYVGEQANSEKSPARLYTLAENSTDKTLDTLAKLPNKTRPEPLGKVGEQIYASRFIGERGYLVTFRVTDPLYVLDLSNPSDPFIASTLEVDGYSDYLHPVGENYLLGIGKSAVVDTNANSDSGAWYQGVKLSLIDISNPAAPFEKQVIHIGKRGTETAASNTHHALTTLLTGDTLQLALPVSLHDNVDKRISEDSDKPWFTYQWTRNELYRLNINITNGEITKLPAVVAKTSEPDPFYNWSWPHDRSAMIGEAVYYLHEDKLAVQ